MKVSPTQWACLVVGLLGASALIWVELTRVEPGFFALFSYDLETELWRVVIAAMGYGAMIGAIAIETLTRMISNSKN